MPVRCNTLYIKKYQKKLKKVVDNHNDGWYYKRVASEGYKKPQRSNGKTTETKKKIVKNLKKVVDKLLKMWYLVKVASGQ